jgi:glycosyltransferase involved in cell wall biosynthesis
MDYKVSIIVTCYNYAAYLQACLESLLQQSYSNWECIIIDDGSTDHTGKLAKSFVDLDSRFRYVYQQNQGVAVARNTAIELITGDYIQFLDGDDLLEIDKLKNQIASFQKNHDLLMSVSPSYFFESDQPQDFYTSKQKEKNTIQPFIAMAFSVRDQLIKDNIFIISAPLIPTHKLGALRFDPAYKTYEDWKFWFEFTKQEGQIIGLDTVNSATLIRFGHASLMSKKLQLNKDALRLRIYFMAKINPFKQVYNGYRIVKLLFKRAYLTILSNG